MNAMEAPQTGSVQLKEKHTMNANQAKFTI
jgi:hypothetical protein